MLVNFGVVHHVNVIGHHQDDRVLKPPDHVSLRPLPFGFGKHRPASPKDLPTEPDTYAYCPHFIGRRRHIVQRPTL